MTRRELLQAIQSRTARVAITASASRGRGNRGVVAGAREFMRQLDLSAFGRNPATFSLALNRSTRSLLKSLPRGARHWGVARKLLNIFLRDCLYTSHLCDAFRLQRAEAAFEVPLDSVTAKSLKRIAGRGGLPQWPGVRHVTPALSRVFQAAAQVEAEKHNVARVHLDAIWWSQSRD